MGILFLPNIEQSPQEVFDMRTSTYHPKEQLEVLKVLVELKNRSGPENRYTQSLRILS